MVAEVIISSSVRKLNRTFDYNIPKNLEELITIGSKVLVPFGNMKKLEEAHVVRIKEKSSFKIKDIEKVENELSEWQMQLANWMAKKYFCNVSACIKLMQLPGVRTKKVENRVTNKYENEVLLNKSIEEIEADIKNKIIKSEKHIKVINFLKDNEKATINEIEMYTDCSRAIVNTLIKNGYLKKEKVVLMRTPLNNSALVQENSKEKFMLNEEQQIAYDKVKNSMNINEFKEFLLFGVTGSGKTEVYLQLIELAIKKGKRAIMLVPEISLTPQIIARFVDRFGKEKIAVIHSKLSVGERHDEWQRIQNDEVDIVIGARSAIFAPVKNLGIIIMDEEHDSSYKSEVTPKYNTKEVARKIAEYNNIPFVLGSATPDIRTFYRATETREIECLEISKRVNDMTLPKVEVVDMKQELAHGNRSMLSRQLYYAIDKNLKEKLQTILFLNRRGYSTFIMCRNCGYILKCKNCNISMTYHKNQNTAKCHYCTYEQKIEKICPECGSDKIRYFGTGTQKLEEEVSKRFPNAKILRMDVDTVTKKNSYEEIINKFKNEDVDILIGTQMVVKGHHFPRVTLVGAVAADTLLNIDDYKATERTFQTLTQVSGRAGREKIVGKEENCGQVIIQTYNPENFSIQQVKNQNYRNFYEIEIELRKQLKYPPFCDIIVIGFKGENNSRLEEVTHKIYELFKQIVEKRKEFENILFFRPMPAPIDKIQNFYRWRMIIKANIDDKLVASIDELLKTEYISNLGDVKISVDVNPNNMN